VAGLHANIDVRRNAMRRVPGCTVVLWDHGPQPPPMVGVPCQADARRMLRYKKDRATWENETRGKPIDCGFNSVDASEARLHDPKRWRTSATATADEIPAQQTTTAGPVVVNLVAASGGGAAFGGFWLQDITTGTKYVVFSPDYIEWQSRGRGQFVPTTPS